jgi:AMMECR1 domain-containing protein
MIDRQELANVPFDLEQLDTEIAHARRDAALAVDRVKALVELRSHALAVYEELQRPLYYPDVLDSNDEEEKAFLNALVNRIAPGDDE